MYRAMTVSDSCIKALFCEITAREFNFVLERVLCFDASTVLDS